MRVNVPGLQSIPAIALGLALLGGAIPAAAQPPSSASAEPAALTEKVRPGDRLTVTTRDLARIRGKLLAVGDDGLLLATDAGTRHVPMASLDQVSRRRHGFLLGPIIGAGVGVGFAIPVSMLFHNEGADATKASAFLIGLGAGVGLLIDAAIDLPRTVYRRDSPARVAIAPQISRDRKGVALQVAF